MSPFFSLGLPLKIDLHVHCRERSACGRASEANQLQAARRAGLDALAFTDHDRLTSIAHVEELNRQYAPLRVFGGVEVSLPEEHIVVLGIQDAALESLDWNYISLWHFVHERGGFMTLAHPFRFHDSIDVPIERYPPHGIEVYSINTAPRNEKRIRELAARLGICLMSDSDAHTIDPLGSYYNDLQAAPANDAELVRYLIAGTSIPFKAKLRV
jgi:predicted metal-dependent phosphoesterase TrpH